MTSRIILIVLLCYCCHNNFIESNSINCNNMYNDLELSSFNLKDLNPFSSTYNQFISPELFTGKIRLFYFSNNENWGTCINRFGLLNNLFIDYQNSVLEDIIIIGIGANNDFGVENIVQNNIIPWVKDDDQNNIWVNWDNVFNRDLFFMNKFGNYIYKINLTSEFNADYIKSIVDCIE